MLTCFVKDEADKSIPVSIVTGSEFSRWLEAQNVTVKNWLKCTNFRGENGNIGLIPDASGTLTGVIYCLHDTKNFFGVGALPTALPEGVYRLDSKDSAQNDRYAIAWGLGAYQFSRYKNYSKKPARLSLAGTQNSDHVINTIESIYYVRDLINTPTDDMGPTELADFTVALGKQYAATVDQIIGDDLLRKGFASIHTVGRASDDAPRLLDLRWGKENHPKVTLVGKGVCFDTGGLDIKPSSGMLLMKKDMGGAAHVLGLARMIMQANLPVRLRVLIPAVENSISGNAYRPGDIIKSRKGLTIEIGNTDAEGRVILADALTEAVSETPDLLIDMSTLTGAARIALGTDIAVFFTNSDQLALDLSRHAEEQVDPVWRLPLFAPYREALSSPIADINNSTSDSYAGAITAGLFLKEFVPDEIPWIHFDMMAWNLKTRPSRPQGGEAMALRALFSYLSVTYK
jgi:leucyl aminopeptidase